MNIGKITMRSENSTGVWTDTQRRMSGIKQEYLGGEFIKASKHYWPGPKKEFNDNAKTLNGISCYQKILFFDDANPELTNCCVSRIEGLDQTTSLFWRDDADDEYTQDFVVCGFNEKSKKVAFNGFGHYNNTKFTLYEECDKLKHLNSKTIN